MKLIDHPFYSKLDLERNKKIDLSNILSKSSKKLWWRCSVASDHLWEAAVFSVINSKNGCPCCRGLKVVSSNCLATKRPDLIKKWNYSKNILTPYDFVEFSHKKMWWACNACQSEWESRIADFVKWNGSCPFCSGQKVNHTNSLLVKNSILSSEWNFDKNYLKPENVTCNSSKKVWWVCKFGHEWQSTISNRTLGNNCPYCAGQKILEKNSIIFTNPDIIRQWHKKNTIDIRTIGRKSSKKVWWQCEKYLEHEWQETISNRTRPNCKGCPFCTGHRVAESNCLAVVNKNLISEWHPDNRIKPTEVTFGSNIRVWWICKKCKHEWKTTIVSRSAGHNCPRCKQSRGELKVKSYLEQNNINFKSQWRHNSCCNLRPLPFDFFIKIKSGFGLIEFQEEQHYIEVKYFKSNLQKIQKNDEIKLKWCKQNNIPLLIIPYWDIKNIHNLIDLFIHN